LPNVRGPNWDDASCKNSIVIEKIKLATVIMELAITDSISARHFSPNVYKSTCQDCRSGRRRGTSISLDRDDGKDRHDGGQEPKAGVKPSQNAVTRVR
jgi:hypothetical protein